MDLVADPDLRDQLDKTPGKQREALLGFLEKRIGDPQALQFAVWVRKYSEYDKLMTILKGETGYGFRPLHPMKNLPPWTDDYADVMRVMMIKELQSVRRFFGLPTLDDE